MRILNVSAFFSGHGGGIELVAGNLAQALSERGHRSIWVATDLDPAPVQKGISAVPLRAFDPIERTSGLPMPILSPGALRKLKEQVRLADGVIIHDALYMPSLAAAHYARRYDKPWLLIQHIGAIPFATAPLRFVMRVASSMVIRPLLARASQAVFISNVIRQEFGDVSFQRAPTLIFNGVDTTIFSPPSAQDFAANRAGLVSKDFDEVFLFVGRFVARKGLAVILELARRRTRALFLLAGDGHVDLGQTHLPNVRILGKLDRTELATLYRSVDALLLPSAGEGYPLVVQEALASGLAVFCGLESASADPGAAPFITGVRVDLADIAGTADRFDIALSHTKKATGEPAARYAALTYNWARNAARIEALFNQPR